MIKNLISFCLTSTLSIGVSSEVLYDIKDLEVLEKDKNFEEFITHAYDVRPSLRDKHWKEMYQTMVYAFIDNRVKNKDFSWNTYQKLKQIAQSSVMTKDEFFHLKYENYAKKFISACYQSRSSSQAIEQKNFIYNCDFELQFVWNNSSKDSENALELAKIASEGKSSIKPWTFYSVVTQDELSHFYCQKIEVQKAIFRQLYEGSYHKDFSGDYKSLIEKNINKKCLEQLISPIKAIVKSLDTGGLDKELALNLLQSTNQLSLSEKDVYSTIFLLSGPVVGDSLNLNWKNIESLSESNARREILLNELKKLKHLPDKVFTDPTSPRNKAIINLFAKNFPEYLNFYAESCLKYLNYSDEKLNIRSAYECNQFLRSGLSNNNEYPWFKDSIKTQFSSLKK